jgi:hypothetical protein
MKAHYILLLSSVLLLNLSAHAQLFSSGNNIIAGNNIGIGTATPTANLHSKANGGTNLTILENTSATGITRLNFQSNGASNFATIQKRGSNVGGTAGVATIPLANLFSFGSNGGAMLVNTQGNIGIAPTISGVIQYKFLTDTLSGNVGLGGNAIPTARIHVNNTQATSAAIKISNNTSGHLLADGLELSTNGNAASITNKENDLLSFGTNNTERMRISANGNVVIGNTTTPSGYKLFVEQGILTEKIKVAVKSGSQWADYVFEPNYSLLPLTETETYIKKYKHLPGIPSANEVVEYGIDVASMDAKLLQKIEELTLHLIAMKKEIEILKKNQSTK